MLSDEGLVNVAILATVLVNKQIASCVLKICFIKEDIVVVGNGYDRPRTLGTVGEKKIKTVKRNDEVR